MVGSHGRCCFHEFKAHYWFGVEVSETHPFLLKLSEKNPFIAWVTSCGSNINDIHLPPETRARLIQKCPGISTSNVTCVAAQLMTVKCTICHTKCQHANQGKVLQPRYTTTGTEISTLKSLQFNKSEPSNFLFWKLFQHSEPFKRPKSHRFWIVADVQLTNECMSVKHEIHESFGSKLESFEFKFSLNLLSNLLAASPMSHTYMFLVVNSTLQPQYTRISGWLHTWENRVVTMLPPAPELKPIFLWAASS